MRRPIRIAWDAYCRFVDDDGWAIASHIALSGLMSLFPFLIFVTALAGFLHWGNLAEEVVGILLEAWPQRVALPLSEEIRNVLTRTRGDVLTISVLLAVYFSSNGIEALRIGLNRAYGVRETRAWWLTRLESIAYVVVGAGAVLGLAVLVVLWPLLWANAVRYAPGLATFGWVITFVRLGVASVLIVGALVIVHLWLPAGRRTLREIGPGIVVTLALSLAGGGVFGSYLAKFADNYVTTYAGLASVMMALVFLYVLASIFVYGGELNSTLLRARIAKGMSDMGREAAAR